MIKVTKNRASGFVRNRPKMNENPPNIPQPPQPQQFDIPNLPEMQMQSSGFVLPPTQVSGYVPNRLRQPPKPNQTQQQPQIDLSQLGNVSNVGGFIPRRPNTTPQQPQIDFSQLGMDNNLGGFIPSTTPQLETNDGI